VGAFGVAEPPQIECATSGKSFSVFVFVGADQVVVGAAAAAAAAAAGTSQVMGG